MLHARGFLRGNAFGTSWDIIRKEIKAPLGSITYWDFYIFIQVG